MEPIGLAPSPVWKGFQQSKRPRRSDRPKEDYLVSSSHCHCLTKPTSSPLKLCQQVGNMFINRHPNCILCGHILKRYFHLAVRRRKYGAAKLAKISLGCASQPQHLLCLPNPCHHLKCPERKTEVMMLEGPPTSAKPSSCAISWLKPQRISLLIVNSP